MSAGPARYTFAWRLCASPWWLASLAAFAVGIGMLHDVVRVLARAHRVRERVELVKAGLAAEAASLAAFSCADDGAPPEWSGSVRAEVVRDADGLVVGTTSATGARHWFTATTLPGAAPAALSVPLAARPDVAATIETDRPVECAPPMPRLDADAIERAPRADVTPLLRRDPGVALLRFTTGTDAEDFVFRRPDDPRQLDGVRDLMVVPGNLWIEPGSGPCEVWLPTDLVLVVVGNLYVLRSVHVTGPGRLLLVTTVPAAATAFVDVDFNGRRAEHEPLLARERFAGPIEGAGAVYLGIVAQGPAIECQAGLVVAGELHLARAGRVTGPLALAHGITRRAAGDRLHAAGEWSFLAERERVPGFVTDGSQRPSRLRYLGQESPRRADTPAMHQQTLYLSSPAR